jgi:hypothetical protein
MAYGLEHPQRCAHFDQRKKLGNIRIVEADTAVGDGLANGARFVGAVEAKFIFSQLVKS